MTVLPTLLYTPSFYVAKPTAKGLQPPDDPAVMGAFAQAMVQRYGPRGTYWKCGSTILDSGCRQPYAPIKAWEIWNEPDHPGWWKGAPNVDEYFALLRSVSTAVRQADPTAEVVLGAMLSTEGSRPGGYLDRLYGLGGGRFFDTLSLNPYAHDVGGMLTFLAGQRAVAAKHGDADKPMRVTEYGWATSGRSASYVTSEGCQGALLHAATTRLRQVRGTYRIKSAIQFQWRDARPNDPNDLWPHFAGMLRHDGSSKPAVAAVAAAVAGKPAPDGLSLQQACPQNRQTLDGTPRHHRRRRHRDQHAGRHQLRHRLRGGLPLQHRRHAEGHPRRPASGSSAGPARPAAAARRPPAATPR
jgi:hypothetical protein